MKAAGAPTPAGGDSSSAAESEAQIAEVDAQWELLLASEAPPKEELEKMRGRMRASAVLQQQMLTQLQAATERLQDIERVRSAAVDTSEAEGAKVLELQDQLQKAWDVHQTTTEKHAQAKNTIKDLRNEIVDLGAQIDAGAGSEAAHAEEVRDLVKTREELEMRIRAKDKEVLERENQVEGLAIELGQEKQKCAGLGTDVSGLKEEIAAKVEDQEREKRRTDLLQQRLREVRAALEAKGVEADELRGLQSGAKEKYQRVENSLVHARTTNEKYLRDYKAVFEKFQAASAKSVDYENAIEELKQKIKKFDVEVLSRDREVRVQKEMVAKLQRALAVEKKRSSRLDNIRGEEKQRREETEAKLLALQSEMVMTLRASDLKSKKVEELNRERDVMKKAIRREEEAVKEQEIAVGVAENTSVRLKEEVASLEREANRKAKLVARLEKERERALVDAAEATNRFADAVKEVKLKELTCDELQKQVADVEVKLKQQQQLYEQVRAEHNLKTKRLNAAEDQMKELAKKFKMTTHQVEQLKNEIVDKIHITEIKQKELDKLKKDKDAKISELNKMTHTKELAEDLVKHQAKENEKHTRMILEMEEEAKVARNSIDQLVSERDILGTQLIRRNDELALLYEKIRIQQSTLRKGEAQYAERQADIRVLKLRVQDMRRKYRITAGQLGSLDEGKKRVFNLQRDLLAEKTKVKALSEELENPLNVHRWRQVSVGAGEERERVCVCVCGVAREGTSARSIDRSSTAPAHAPPPPPPPPSLSFVFSPCSSRGATRRRTRWYRRSQRCRSG